MAGKSKYAVGHEFANHKRLVECVGSDPKFRVKLWIWECMNCGKKHGPSRTPSITRLDRKPRCCYMPKQENNPNWRGYEQLHGKWLNEYKQGAAKRELTWDVTPEYLWQQWLDQQGKCWYTGRDLVLYSGRGFVYSASLDREDNSKGYVDGNVHWVHTNINRMKSDFSADLFLHMCKDVAAYAR